MLRARNIALMIAPAIVLCLMLSIKPIEEEMMKHGAAKGESI